MASSRHTTDDKEPVQEPVQPTIEELLVQLEAERQARLVAKAAAEQAQTDAAQAMTEVAQVRQQMSTHLAAVEAQYQSGAGQGDDDQARGLSLLDNIRFVMTIVQQLLNLGMMYTDHRQVTQKGTDGLERPRWVGYERPLTPADILSIREEPEENGYIVVTADGKKYRHVVV